MYWAVWGIPLVCVHTQDYNVVTSLFGRFFFNSSLKSKRKNQKKKKIRWRKKKIYALVRTKNLLFSSSVLLFCVSVFTHCTQLVSLAFKSLCLGIVMEFQFSYWLISYLKMTKRHDFTLDYAVWLMVILGGRCHTFD